MVTTESQEKKYKNCGEEIFEEQETQNELQNVEKNNSL